MMYLPRITRETCIAEIFKIFWLLIFIKAKVTEVVDVEFILGIWMFFSSKTNHESQHGMHWMLLGIVHKWRHGRRGMEVVKDFMTTVVNNKKVMMEGGRSKKCPKLRNVIYGRPLSGILFDCCLYLN